MSCVYKDLESIDLYFLSSIQAKKSLIFDPKSHINPSHQSEMGGRHSRPPVIKMGGLKFDSDEYCQDDFLNETVNILGTDQIHRIFRAKGLGIRQGKSRFAGFVKYLPSMRMDYTVLRFTVSCSRCAVSCDLLRFGLLSYDSVKYKGAPCVQGIEYVAQNRQK